MKSVFRFDRGTLRKPVRTPQGFLRVDGVAARCGVQEYLDEKGGIRLELRLPEDVFARATLDGFEGAPYTDGHPPVAVTSTNVKQYEVGTVTGPARRDGDLCVVSIVVKDPQVIAGLERGDTGLSTGYAVDLEETPGVHPIYGAYHAIQRNIVINHLAGRVSPRAGEVARVRMDDAGHILDDAAAVAARAGDQIDRQRAAREGVSMADKTDKQRADELETSNSTLRAEITRLEGLIAANAGAQETAALTAAKARADAADQKLRDMETAFVGAVRARVALLVEARSQLGAVIRLDDMTDRQIQEAVIKRLDSSANVSGENEDQVRGRYTTLVGLAVRNTESQARVAEILGRGADARNDGGGQPAESYEDIQNNRWKNQLNKGRTAAQEGR